MLSISRPSSSGAAAMFVALLFVAFSLPTLLTSCDKEKHPGLSEAQLEEILYEYHLLEALRTTLNLDSTHSQLYLDDIFKRHNTSQEEFDATMAYYMRHNDILYEVYQRLSERIEKEALAQGADNMAFGILTGDTANVWRGRTAHIFNQHAPYNLLQFSIPADTAFHAGDKLTLSFFTDFMFESGTRSGLALLAVTLGNDSVVTRTAYLSSSMNQTLEIADDERLGIKGIQGFFLQKESTQKAERNSSATRMMIVRDIRLIRMHNEPAPEEPNALGEEKAVVAGDSIVNMLVDSGTNSDSVSYAPSASKPETAPATPVTAPIPPPQAKITNIK